MTAEQEPNPRSVYVWFRGRPPTLMELVERLRNTEYQHGLTAATCGDSDKATLAHKARANEIAAEIERRFNELGDSIVQAANALADIAEIPRGMQIGNHNEVEEGRRW